MIRSLALLCLLWLAGGVPAAGAQGRIVTATLPSQALLGNRIGDSVDRPITVYLPPSYDKAPSRRYPVLYLLHGATSVPAEWLDGTYQGMDLRAALDQQAAQGEFLVVMPMADNRFGGSFYVDSPAFGHWDTFVARELVDFIDRRFRTLPLRRYRGLAGHSMGGFGALSVAGRHPGVFGHVYAASPCCLALVGDLARDGERWQRPLGGWLRAMAMAFDPDPRGASEDAAPPLPFAPGADGSMHAVPTVMARWQRELPAARTRYAACRWARPHSPPRSPAAACRMPSPCTTATTWTTCAIASSSTCCPSSPGHSRAPEPGAADAGETGPAPNHASPDRNSA